MEGLQQNDGMLVDGVSSSSEYSCMCSDNRPVLDYRGAESAPGHVRTHPETADSHGLHSKPCMPLTSLPHRHATRAEARMDIGVDTNMMNDVLSRDKTATPASVASDAASCNRCLLVLQALST